IPPTVYSDGEVILLSILTMLLCSLGLFGNLTVILVIWKDRVISKHRQNLYLLSLAVADASLVVLVVPFSLTNELLGHWPFGAVYCRIYLSVDILLCTASIWNICVIGLDRYISVKYPMTYRKFRTMPKIRLFIISVWLFAAGVSLLPFVSEIETINSERGCFINASSWYIVASCLLSFFVPSFIIWPVYIKIYMIGRDLEISKRARHTIGRHKNLWTQSSRNRENIEFVESSSLFFAFSGFINLVLEPRHHPTPNQNGRNGAVQTRQPKNPNKYALLSCIRRCSQKITGRTEQHKHRVAIAVNRSADDGSFPESSKPKVHQNFRSDTTSHRSAVYLTEYSKSGVDQWLKPPIDIQILIKTNESITVCKPSPKKISAKPYSCANAMSRRERRFVCIISIITGCFMACWMPFFLTYSIYAICRNCCLNNTLFKVFFWLGYLNSALNPVLYTAFNKDFRSAFKRLFRADSNRTSR
uniref:G-protein coupled receptors family 1 profile domain-containing protein n=1 Tax=Ciona savignyi TaxID=51511 RepID=H2ZCJ3_CIOSA